MRKILIFFLLLLSVSPSAFAEQSDKAALPDLKTLTGDTGHWVALSEEYVLEIIQSHEETLSPQEWDSQMIIRAKLAQLPKVVKALRFFASEKSKSTIKAMRILGYTDIQTPALRALVAEHLQRFEEIKAELEAVLLPDDDDSDLEE